MAKFIKTPQDGPVVLHTGSDEEAEAVQAKLDRRHEFIVKFCGEKGWPTNPKELTIEQIMEIRNQPGWRDA